MGWLLAVVALVLGVVAIVAGVRGTHADIFAAITGHTADSGAATSTPGPWADITQALVDDATANQQPNAAPITRVGRAA